MKSSIKHVLGVFIDLSFDIISHDKLLIKLDRYTVGPKVNTHTLALIAQSLSPQLKFFFW